ncbi:H-NS histone family protein [Paraburkholderia kururiensis]|uniref:H-NS histone family protein n=1 Tax=Paraburkholderia kururiensis TaxID=984307 RepID=UPI000F86FE95|nr:H-NS histone family protein [Paraburkholderia kururiensis]
MTTYLELKAKLEALQQEAEAARLAELDAVISEIRATIHAYGLTVKDVFDSRDSPILNSLRMQQPKYRNPQTGATWSGRGRPPAWLKGQKRELYLIRFD